MEAFGLFIFFGGWLPIAVIIYALVRALPAIEDGQSWFVSIGEPLGRLFRWPWFTFLCPAFFIALIIYVRFDFFGAMTLFFLFFLPLHLGPFLVLYSGFEGRARLKHWCPLVVATLIAFPWAYLLLRIHMPNWP